MKAILYSTTKWLCAVLIFTASHRAYGNNVLEIAVENDAGPWSYPDGSGLANDIVKEAFKAVGVKVELSVVPYARCKDMVLSGKSCACFSMSWLTEFQGAVAFSARPLFTCKADYFIASGSTLSAQSQEQLPHGSVIGVVIGYEYPPALYALQKAGKIQFDESESEELNLRKLAAGRVDAALINYNDSKPWQLTAAKAGVSGQVKRAFRCGLLKSHIGFSLRHPQGPDARKNFDRGYKIIASDGRLATIEKRWKKSLPENSH